MIPQKTGGIKRVGPGPFCRVSVWPRRPSPAGLLLPWMTEVRVHFPSDSFSIGPHRVSPPLVREIGGVGLTVSEMISCEALIRRARKAEAMMASDGGRPFAMQVVGSVPEHLAEAARMCEAAGADLVDLNMGCPVKKITGNFRRNTLMNNVFLFNFVYRLNFSNNIFPKNFSCLQIFNVWSVKC